MALPTYQAVGTAVNGVGNITVAWPTHAVDDIALLFVESRGEQAAALGTANGFVEVTNSPQNTGATTAGTRLTVFWCRATSASMASPIVTDPGNHAYGVILTFRGVHATGDPWNVTAGDVKASASTTTTSPSVTTTIDDCLIVMGITKQIDSTAAFASSPTNGALSSLTERFDAGTTSGDGGGIAVIVGGKATAGATGTTAHTVTSSVSAMLTIALKPVNSSPTVALNTPNDVATGVSTTPDLLFTGTDVDSDEIEYNVQVDTDNTFATVATYYFDGHISITDPNTGWNDDANGFDGSTATSATSIGNTATKNLIGKGTNAPSSDKQITQVRARAYVQKGGPGPNTSTKIYTESQAELLGNVQYTSGTPGYSSYIILSTPSGGWTWDKIKKLESYMIDGNTGDRLYVAEVEVTSSSLLDKLSATPDDTFTGTGDPHPWPSGNQVTYTVQDDIVGSNVTSGSDVDGTATATTASVSPGSNNLLLLSIANTDNTTAAPTGIAGLGLTWVIIADRQYNTAGTLRRISTWRALGAVTPGTIVITFSGGTNDIYWSLDQFSGVVTSGTNGSGAIVQEVDREETPAAVTASVTLAAFSHANNATYGAFGSSGSDGATVGSGFTLGATVGTNANNVSLLTEWKATNDTVVDYSQTNSHKMGAVGIELKAAILTNNTTYYWRVRAIDPLGSNTYGAWSSTRSFTTASGAGGVIPNKIYKYLQAINRSNTY